MHDRYGSRFRLVIAGALVAAGCGGAARGGPRPATTFDPIAQARADSARYPYTVADIHFVTGMIHHHGQAITMSKLAASHGANPAVRTLAERIINAQTDEITLMQQWLRDRRQPATEPDPAGMRMMMHGVEHDMLMPGMLTEAQMKELDAARGQEFDRRFLQLMIQHHRGAIAMVQDLLDSEGAAQDATVFKLAADINAEQETEIRRMQSMLFTMIIDR
jgi:uncharacterized protein (DUF305 family)